MPKTQIKQADEPQTLTSTIGERLEKRSRALSLLPWILMLLVLIAAAGFVYHQHREGEQLQQQLADLKQNPQKASEQETKALLEKVGQLIELPAEQPTIATVTDLGPLKDQAFFASAQVGDKVLIFSQAKKAVLYRPSTNKVIEVAPVNLDNQPTANTNGNVNTNTNANTNKTSNSNVNVNSNTNTGTQNKATTNKNTNTPVNKIK